jgi:predicted nucleic acid-binding protein
VSRTFIADASVAIGWVHPAQSTREARATLEALGAGDVLEVPALWPLEVANALTVLMRRRKLTADDRRSALGWLRALPIKIDHEASALAFTRIAELASEHQLSVYDAVYLELARRRGLPLATLDARLAEAARATGVAVLP